MTGPFARILRYLRDAAEHGQPGRRDEVLVSRRALMELIRDYDRLDADARARHRAEFPEAYPPT
ncbi:hypothetical protein MAL1_00197 [Bacteriophage DSS3_MAL1]|nr:hypothetical protein MAL1_00197 [Bacteriophage DSS3_MAL1]